MQSRIYHRDSRVHVVSFFVPFQRFLLSGRLHVRIRREDLPFSGAGIELLIHDRGLPILEDAVGDEVLGEHVPGAPLHTGRSGASAEGLILTRAVRRTSHGGCIGAVVPLLAGVGYFSWAGPAPRPEGPPAVARKALLVSTAVVPVGGFGDLAGPLVRPVVMTLTVSARSQLRIDVDGERFLARVVEPGEQLQVEVREYVELSGSDAGAVQLSINGQAGRMLGFSGEPLSARIDRDDYAAFLASR